MKGVIATASESWKAIPQIVEMPGPQPGKGDVLVKIMATWPSCLDVYYKDYALLPAKRKQKNIPATGIEFSGIVASDGEVFKKDDAVVGAIDYTKGNRTYARNCYSVSIPYAQPQNLTHTQSASYILDILTAIEALLVSAKVKEKSSLLINGATGSVGIYAVHIARALQCDITTTCSSRNIDYLQNLGVNTVLDYRDEISFTKNKFDLIFDAAGK